MRKLYTLLLLLLVASAARATHMSGGEIYWDCIGPNQFRITLTIYRDCAGINLDNDYDLELTSPCGNRTLNVTTPGGVELSQLCDLQLPNSTCNGGTLPGIQQYVYTGVITLPPCDSWSISWTEIYRNNAIVNLTAPGTREMYIEAELNNADAPCNDSPTFTNTAIPYICLGYPISYSYGAVDPEGDSLSYSLIGARMIDGLPIPYVAPYSGAQPITGLTLDPLTGLVEFTLNLAGNWVVVVLVTEYDDQGNVIGTVMRDMQFVAYPCTNVPPDPATGLVGGMTGGAVQTGPRAVQVCESGDFCFDMVISDANANNVLEAVSNVASNLPGATFSYTGTNPITCHVCWNAAPGTAGFYPFIVNVNDGACPIVAFQTYVYSITVLEGLFIDVTSTDESCAGANDGTASVSIVAGTGPYQYNWATLGATSASITAGQGNYPVQVTDANGCIATPETAVIGTTLPPTANGGPDVVACFGSWPISLNGLTTQAQSSGWSGGAGVWAGSGLNMSYTPTAAEIAAGSADVVFTANANGTCPDAVDPVHIDISNTFVGATITNTDATCNGSATGTATFTPAGPGIDITWNTTPAQTSATATGLAAGSYTASATDALGCPFTLTTQITEPAVLAITGLQPVAETCAGSANGTLTASVSGGTAPYSYAWSTGNTTASITGGAGSYTLVVTDANNCTSAPASASITAGAQPNVAQAGPDQVTCMDALPVSVVGSVVNATGGSWSGGAGTINGNGLSITYQPTQAEIQAGLVDLILTTTGNTGCPADTDTVRVALSNSFLNAAIASTDAECAASTDGTASFTPDLPGLTYAWNTVPVQSSATATGLAAGSYTVTATDALGCPWVLSTTVGAPAAITIPSIQSTDETCAGLGNGSVTVTVSGGTAPYTYLWSTNATTSSITAGAGTYSVSVSDANGCPAATANATVLAAAQPTQALAGADQVVCMQHYPISLNGQVVNSASGAWSGGNGTFFGTGAQVSYTPSNTEILNGGVDLYLTSAGVAGCPADQDTVHLTLANAFLNAAISGTAALCAGASTGTATFAPSLPALQYVWAPSGQITPTAIGLPAGIHTVSVTDALGCDTTMSITIAEPTPVIVSGVQTMDPTCFGSQNGSATATVAGGTGAYTYQWSANAGSQTTAVASGLGAGNFVVVVTDANGCSAQGTAALTEPAAIQLLAQVPDTVCVNAPTQLTAQATGGNGVLSIDWAGIGSGTSIMYSFPQSQTVTVSVTDAAGCTGPTLQLPVTVLDLSNAQLITSGDTTVCVGGVALVSASVAGYPGVVSYSWSGSGLTTAGPHPVPVNATQTLQVLVTDVCGASLAGTVELVLEIPPSIVLPEVIGEGCAPFTVQFPDSLTQQVVTWNWNLGDGTTSTAPAPVHTYAAGNYTVSLSVTTPAGCTADALNTSSVIAHAPPSAAFTASTYSTDMDAPTITFTNTSAGSINAYDWSFGDGGTSNTDDPTYTYNDIGEFDVVLVVTDVNGCTDEATSTIEILPIYDIVIPNAFTPNPNGGGGGTFDPNDLSNDVFYPFVRYVKEFNMRVWNRWGELIFESTDPNVGWDGYYRGQLSPQDVYVYKCSIRFVDDREAERTGDITLFR